MGDSSLSLRLMKRDVLAQDVRAESFQAPTGNLVPAPARTAGSGGVARDRNPQAQLFSELPDVGEPLHLGAIQMRGLPHGPHPDPEELAVLPATEAAAEDPEPRGDLAHRV